MSTGIKPKVRATNRQFSEHAKRYAFYPLSNLNFAGTQWLSPIWNPSMPRARFYLIESFEYRTQVVDETNDSPFGSNGIQLGERTMGTDAQAKFLMGNADGTGYMYKGMTILESLTDVDPETALEIEMLLLPSDEEGEITIPDTLIGLRNHLNSVVVTGDNPVSALAVKTLAELKDGVNRAINYCRQTTAELEKELADGLAGRVGIRTIDPSNAHYFKMIEKSLPSEKAVDANAGLVEILSKALQGSGIASPQVSKEAELEAKANQELIERLKADNLALTETVNKLTTEED